MRSLRRDRLPNRRDNEIDDTIVARLRFRRLGVEYIPVRVRYGWDDSGGRPPSFTVPGDKDNSYLSVTR